MVAKEYSIAYTEVLEILKHMPKKDYNKLPKEKINFYASNCEKEYSYKLNPNVNLKNQKMTEITKAILANLYRDYWATPKEKRNIIKKEMSDLEKIEELKREKYNPDDIFKSRKEIHVDTDLENNSEKRSFFKRFFSYFFN